MKAYEATTTIQASPEKIWEILEDTANYANWDPGTIRVEGQIALGEKASSSLNSTQIKPLLQK